MKLPPLEAYLAIGISAIWLPVSETETPELIADCEMVSVRAGQALAK